MKEKKRPKNMTLEISERPNLAQLQRISQFQVSSIIRIIISSIVSNDSASLVLGI